MSLSSSHSGLPPPCFERARPSGTWQRLFSACEEKHLRLAETHFCTPGLGSAFATHTGLIARLCDGHGNKACEQHRDEVQRALRLIEREG